MVLIRKLLRELRAQKGQAIAVLAVTSLGILLFVATAGAYMDLRDSYAHTRSELRLAQLHLDVTQVSPEQVHRATTLPGVRAADARVATEIPVEISHDGTALRVSLRVLSIPAAGQPVLDRVLLLSGRMPQAPGEVLLEKHLAQHHQLKAGDEIVVHATGAAQTLSISGVGESAEYLWVSRDENDVFPSPDSFGVGWMRRDDLRDLALEIGGAKSELPGVAVAASTAAGNQLLLDCAAPSEAGTLSEVKQLLGSEQVLRSTPAGMLVGIRLLQMDVDGYKQMAGFFPLFFLGVGIFIVASILARLVDAQRPIVGTLMALGVGRARVLAHYLGYSLLLGGSGAVLGALLGLAAAPAMTNEYAVELGIPLVVTRLHWDLVLWGIAAGTAAALLAGVVPALHASSLPPAAAMRPPRPSAGTLSRLTRRLKAPLALRLAIRDLLGRPMRSLATALGVSAALVLVLTTGGMLDSMTTTFDALFKGAHRYDLRVDLSGPEPISALRQRYASISGIDRMEPLIAVPAVLRAGDHRENVLLQGLAEDANLLRSVDIDRREVLPKEGGIVLTRSVAGALHVLVGGEVRVKAGPLPEAVFRVSGFADAAMGKTATARMADLLHAAELGDLATAVAIKVQSGQRDAVKRAVSALPDAAHVEDASDLREQMKSLMALGWAMLFVMLTCSVVLAAAILFNTATLAILERRRELATLRALGRTLREIAMGLTAENALLALIGLVIGVPLGVLATKGVLSLYSSELFVLPFVFSPRTLVAAAAGIVGVLLVAQWPALRSFSRASLAESVRVREG